MSTISNAKIKGIEKDITESKPKQEKQIKEKNDTSDKKNKTKDTKDKSKAKQQ
ncbi:unnamed protein product [Paramecium pentaurelia]|nr:unnamed protein product [Paramecium pentaurelia]